MEIVLGLASAFMIAYIVITLFKLSMNNEQKSVALDDFQIVNTDKKAYYKFEVYYRETADSNWYLRKTFENIREAEFYAKKELKWAYDYKIENVKI